MKVEINHQKLLKLMSFGLGGAFYRLRYLYKASCTGYDTVEKQEAILSNLLLSYPRVLNLLDLDNEVKSISVQKLIKELLVNLAENYPRDAYPISVECSFNPSGYMFFKRVKFATSYNFISTIRLISFPIWDTYAAFEAPENTGDGYDYQRAISAYRREIFRDGRGLQNKFDLLIGTNPDRTVYYFGENQTPLSESDFIHCFYSAYAYWLLSTQPTVIDVIVSVNKFEIVFDFKSMILNAEILDHLLNNATLCGSIDNLSIENFFAFNLFEDDDLFKKSYNEFNQKINLFNESRI